MCLKTWVTSLVPIPSEAFRNVSQLRSQARIPVCLHCNTHILEAGYEGVTSTILLSLKRCFLVLPWLLDKTPLPACRMCRGWSRRRGMPSALQKCFMHSARCRRCDRLSRLLALSAVPELSQLIQGCATIMVNTRLEHYSESFLLFVLLGSAERRVPENGVSSYLQQLLAKG